MESPPCPQEPAWQSHLEGGGPLRQHLQRPLHHRQRRRLHVQNRTPLDFDGLCFSLSPE